MFIKRADHNVEYSTKVIGAVFRDTRLSDGATVMYWYLCELPDGADFVVQDVMTKLRISRPVFNRRMDELKKIDLVYIEPATKEVDDLYIGYPCIPASEVPAKWKDEIDLELEREATNQN